jgi:hypothetical protein
MRRILIVLAILLCFGAMFAGYAAYTLAAP